MVLITIVAGAYKPTYNWGVSHCSCNHGIIGFQSRVRRHGILGYGWFRSQLEHHHVLVIKTRFVSVETLLCYSSNSNDIWSFKT